MKLINRYIAVFATLIVGLTVSAQSSIKVMDITNGSVSVDKNSASKGEDVTIMITPNEGYYFVKENLQVVMTVDPSMAATRTDVPVITPPSISGTDPDDLSMARQYTFTNPEDGYEIQISATFTERSTIADAMVSLSETSFRYNGRDQKPTVSVAGLTEGIDYTVSFAETSWTNVGTYSVTVTGKSKFQGTVTKSFVIASADGSMTPPSAKTGLTYTGSAQDLVNAGTSDTGTFQYSLDGVTFGTTIPQGTDAKEYTVYYKLIGDANHSDVEIQSFKVIIAPKVIDHPTISLSETSYTYDGQAKQPTVTVNDGSTTIPSTEYTVSYSDNLNVGTATVSIIDNDGGNYIVSGIASFTIAMPTSETAEISIDLTGKASYAGLKSLDLSGTDEVKAFIATGFDAETGIVWLARIKNVPAGEPVLIMGEVDSDHKIPAYDGKYSYCKNFFVGNSTGATIKISERSSDGKFVNYYLSEGQFKSVNGSADILDNECYLQLPANLDEVAEGGTRTVKIPSVGILSYAAPCNLDFSNVEGLKAFVATGCDKSTGTIWLARVMRVRKGEGVILKGTANQEYRIPSTDQLSAYNNMFIGNISDATIEILPTDGNSTNYYLSNGQFVSVDGSAKISNNECYLQLPTESLAGTRSSSYNSFKLEEVEVESMKIFKSNDGGDDTNGIDDPILLDFGQGTYYNLQGQRVGKPSKGVYIHNGKKVVVK